MPIGIPAAIIGSAALGAGASIIGSNKAASAASDASNSSNELQRYMYDQNRADQQPFYNAGVGAVNQLAQMVGPGGQYSRPFTMADYQQDPGYQFRLTEGMKALERTAAARGGLLSGATLKAAQRYGQDAASSEYQNAYNRFYNDRNQMLNPLQSLAGVGQTSANQLGQVGQNYAGAVGNNNMMGAQARGSAYVGGANAINGGIGQYLNYQNQQDWMNRLRPAPNFMSGENMMQAPVGQYNGYDFGGG